MRLVYSVTKCLEIIEAKGMPDEDALEYFYLNVKSAYIEDNAPIFCFDDFIDVV
jgi:hypothetical protein